MAACALERCCFLVYQAAPMAAAGRQHVHSPVHGAAGSLTCIATGGERAHSCLLHCLQARMEAQSAQEQAQDLQERLGELQQAAQVGG